MLNLHDYLEIWKFGDTFFDDQVCMIFQSTVKSKNHLEWTLNFKFFATQNYSVFFFWVSFNSPDKLIMNTNLNLMKYCWLTQNIHTLIQLIFGLELEAITTTIFTSFFPCDHKYQWVSWFFSPIFFLQWAFKCMNSKITLSKKC